LTRTSARCGGAAVVETAALDPSGRASQLRYARALTAWQALTSGARSTVGRGTARPRRERSTLKVERRATACGGAVRRWCAEAILEAFLAGNRARSAVDRLTAAIRNRAARALRIIACRRGAFALAGAIALPLRRTIARSTVEDLTATVRDRSALFATTGLERNAARRVERGPCGEARHWIAALAGVLRIGIAGVVAGSGNLARLAGQRWADTLRKVASTVRALVDRAGVAVVARGP
jgi:hypothetical protein